MIPQGHGESTCENFPSFIPHDPHSAVMPQTSMLKALSLASESLLELSELGLL